MTNAPSTRAFIHPESDALAGEGEIEPRLLSAALAEVNRIYTSKGLETARAIGEYLLAHFFGGSLVAFQSRGKRHATFAALVDAVGLRFSPSYLWYSLELLEQLRVLPEELASALPMSHHRILMHVENPEARTQLARDAAEGNLSKRELGERAQALKAATPVTGARRGRPPTPNFVKVLAQLGKVRDLAESSTILRDEVAAFPAEEAKALLSEAEAAQATMEEYIDRLRQVVEAAETN